MMDESDWLSVADGSEETGCTLGTPHRDVTSWHLRQVVGRGDPIFNVIKINRDCGESRVFERISANCEIEIVDTVERNIEGFVGNTTNDDVISGFSRA